MSWAKKALPRSVCLVIGMCLLLGVCVPLTTEANSAAKGTALSHRQREVSPVRIAARIADTYGVSSVTVLKHHAGGMSFKELYRAAFLANASGKPLDTVISYKTAFSERRSNHKH